MSKTTDYATRLVITAPELKVDKLEDMDSDLDYAAMPLHSVISNYTPYMIFAIKRYFENAFSGNKALTVKNLKTGEEEIYHVKDYQMQFSEEEIKKQMDRFRMGYSDRLEPVHVETTEGKIVNLRFKGFNTTKEEFDKGVGLMPIVDRDLTWCDILYICAEEVCQDKHVLICRYPISKIVA